MTELLWVVLTAVLLLALGWWWIYVDRAEGRRAKATPARTPLPATYEDIRELHLTAMGPEEGDLMIVELVVDHRCVEGGRLRARREFRHPEQRLPDRVIEWLEHVALKFHNDDPGGWHG